MRTMVILQLTIFFLIAVQGCSSSKSTGSSAADTSLTVIAIGDVGEWGSTLRGNAKYINRMCIDGDPSRPDLLIFLGDNFYPTGLNLPVDEVESKIKKLLGPFRPAFEKLGRENVFAVAGNHDYYARNALEQSLLFGLIDIRIGPVGLSDRGNERARAISWWRYFYKMPVEKVYPVSTNGRDSVQFVFIDSSLPLRSSQESWKPALDSLRRILAASASRPGIAWRVLAQHQPWHSVGEHGGYSIWDDETRTVTYLPNCDKDSNVVQWFLNDIDPQDICAEKYQALLDSLKSIVRTSNAKIHLTLAGHEHSLQLLNRPAPNDHLLPAVHIISGAGAKTTKVKSPTPPEDFAAPCAEHEGESLGGFAQLTFVNGMLRVTFIDAEDGTAIDMGGNKKEFWINRDGVLLP